MEFVAIVVPKDKKEQAERLRDKAIEEVINDEAIGVPDPRYVLSRFETLARKEGKKEFFYYVIREQDIPVDIKYASKEEREKLAEAIIAINDDKIRLALAKKLGIKPEQVEYEVIYKDFVSTWLYDPAPRVGLDLRRLGLVVAGGVAGGAAGYFLVDRKERRMTKKKLIASTIGAGLGALITYLLTR